MGYLITQLSRVWENFIFTIGTHLTISVGGVFFFGFPVAFSISAYVLAISQKAGVSPFFAITFALAAAVLVGIFFSALYRRLSADSFAVFTLASILAFDALVRS